MQIWKTICLGQEEIDIWTADMDCTEADVQHLAGHLSAGETMRAARFRALRDRNCYVVRRGILREIIAGYMGCGPREVEIQSDSKGKPHVTDEEHEAALQFSISQSEGLAVFAFGRCASIGVDIEKIVDFPEMREVASLNFISAEIKEIDSAHERDRVKTFFKLWTRKEAVLKAKGDGLLLPLSCVDVSTPNEEASIWETRIKGDSLGSQYRLMDVMAAPGFAAAVAAVCNGHSFEVVSRNY